MATSRWPRQVKNYDGPWEQPEDLHHESAVGKYSRGTSFGEFEVSASAYHATWQPTEQIPERAIGTSVCANEFCTLDPTARGETTRFIASARATGEDWLGTLYMQYYDWEMSSNPTYDYQIDQFDRRTTYGGRLHEDLTRQRSVADQSRHRRPLRRHRPGRRRSHRTRGLIESLGDHAVREGSLAVYSEATWTPAEPLRVLVGLRGDTSLSMSTQLQAGFAEASDTRRSSHRNSASLIASRPQSSSMRTGDAASIRMMPRGVVGAGHARCPDSFAAREKKLGVRFELGTLTLTGTYWWLDVDSELKFVGDSNSVEPSNGAKRRGYELVGFWRPQSWLAIDAVWTGSHARLTDSTGRGLRSRRLETAGELGVSAIRNAGKRACACGTWAHTRSSKTTPARGRRDTS